MDFVCGNDRRGSRLVRWVGRQPFGNPYPNPDVVRGTSGSSGTNGGRSGVTLGRT